MGKKSILTSIVKKRIQFLKIGFFLLIFILSLLSLLAYYDKPVLAEASCPSHINPESIECLDYLRNQLGEVQNKQRNLQKQIANEEYQQLSLQEKINYTNNLISQTENQIKILEVQIAALNIEIKLLENSISEMEDNISLLSQEIIQLENSVNRRVTESYKYSFVRPLELFLDVKSLSTIIRKSKYLAITRTQDKRYLEEYSDKVLGIKIEEEILADKRSYLQIARNKVDEERVVLSDTRKDLSAQKAEREYLLAQSKAKEAELLAVYQENVKKLADLDRAIINYINTHQSDIVDEGWVTPSIAIGRMGNTGLSSGAHLHFGLNSGRRYDWWGYFWSDVNLFANGYLRKGGNSFLYWSHDDWWSPFVLPGSVRVPLAGNYIIMTQDEHQGNAIDLVSYSQNAWGYKIDGAPVYPIMEGQLYKGVDGYGGKYAIIHHPNGMVSVYLHLQ